jgi:AraC-like DNA-binding protein
MFYLAGVGLSFFLSLLLLSKQKKPSADKILATWLLIITAHLLLFYFRKMWVYSHTLGVDIPIPLMHGPFLYLYTLSLTDRSSSWKISLLHFIPALAVFVYVIPFFLIPVEQKIYVYKNQGVGYETFGNIKSIAIIVSGVSYVTASSVVLRKHRVAIANEFSNAEKVNLQWLQYLIYWIGVIWLLIIFTNDDWVFVGAVLFILFIGFFGIKQAGIFHTHEISQANEMEAKNVLSDDVREKRKYEKSGLDDQSAETLHRQLIETMNSKKLYCENELSLTELAKHLNTQPNYLSQVINEREEKSFYDYINALRIEEFKRLAVDPESRKYTLLALAQQCGFNSKSSFNRYFKKATGQSPSEFVVTALDSQK